MAVYAIGDIQGCYDELMQLLEKIQFDQRKDKLWFVGDLVNRGPKSLETLRFVKGLGSSAVTVLGNHDLHLLAMAYGSGKKPGTLAQVLKASDADELIYWLRHRPLMHYDADLDFNLIHAGLPPVWTIEEARVLAQEVTDVLRGDDHPEYFAGMYGDKPRRWKSELSGMKRWRYITNCFTRLRYCTRTGKLALGEKNAPNEQYDPGDIPWFEYPKRASADARIVFGHWSTLGYFHRRNVWAIDTGCLWGGSLTALQLDHADGPRPHFFSCKQKQNPSAF